MTNATVAALVRARALFDGKKSSPRFHKRGYERMRVSHIKFEEVTMGHATRHSAPATP